MHPQSTPDDVIVVPLNQGKSALIDAADADLVLPFQWDAHVKSSGIWYARRQIHGKFKGLSRAYMHRLIMPPPPGMIVDHINRNGLDNRRCNLRIGTIAQNAMNKRGQRNASSRFKGVTWSHHVSKWVASINEGGKRRHLGCFVSEIEAALAYDAAARILHGDWACLNFPDHDST